MDILSSLIHNVIVYIALIKKIVNYDNQHDRQKFNSAQNRALCLD
jgi:hypothetical protein